MTTENWNFEVSKLKIEKNVPVPPQKGMVVFQWKDTILKMANGDSILIPVTDYPHKNRIRANLLAARRNWAKGFRLTTRSETNGLRVWKVKDETCK